MKKYLILLFLFPYIVFAQQQTVTYSINPTAFEGKSIDYYHRKWQ